MNNIDKIIFINLKKREDRYNEILEEFTKYEFPIDKIIRFEAIETPGFGILGCGQSHLGVLKMAKENNWKNVLILEDDFKIVVSKDQFYESLSYFFNNIHNQHNWDVLMLAYNTNDPCHKTEYFDSILGKIRFCQSASAYIVNQSYYDILIENLEKGNHLLGTTKRHWEFANDVYWKVLQEKDNWFYFLNRLSIQRPSFSDNSCKFHNYGI